MSRHTRRIGRPPRTAPQLNGGAAGRSAGVVSGSNPPTTNREASHADDAGQQTAIRSMGVAVLAAGGRDQRARARSAAPGRATSPSIRSVAATIARPRWPRCPAGEPRHAGIANTRDARNGRPEDPSRPARPRACRLRCPATASASPSGLVASRARGHHVADAANFEEGVRAMEAHQCTAEYRRVGAHRLYDVRGGAWYDGRGTMGDISQCETHPPRSCGEPRPGAIDWLGNCTRPLPCCTGVYCARPAHRALRSPPSWR